MTLTFLSPLTSHGGRRRAAKRLAEATLTLCVFWAGGLSARAQNIQFTQGGVGSGLDHSMEIPLRDYPSRGAAFSVSLYYSSKVWRIGHLETVNNGGVLQTVAEAIYAEHSTAGWTTSLDLPKIEWPGEKDQYNSSGKEFCSACGTGGGWRVPRLYVHMPGGSTHELRKSDAAFRGPVDQVGTFYSVDGSRLRYDSAGATAGTLYLPDGTRYVLGGATAKLIDRHGNTLNYEVATRRWTDALGRVVGLPWPASPQAQDYVYTLPGLGGAPLTYVFRWRRLSDSLLDPGSRSVRPAASHYLPSPASPPTAEGGGNFPQPNGSSYLFVSDTPPDEDTVTTLVVGRGQQQGQPFDPVVLSEVILPNGLKYQFFHNEFGEVAKVIYPAGGFDRFTYAPVPASADLRTPYAQANRGVTLREQSADGTGQSLARWQYAAAQVWDSVFVGSEGDLVVTTTAPDNTRTESRRRIYRPAAFGRNNARYWPFGYSDPRGGETYDERVYAPNPDGSPGPMLRRKLSEFEFTSRTIPPRLGFEGERVVTAHRNLRTKRSVSLMLDTGEGGAERDALAKSLSYEYDTAREMTTGVDMRVVTETHFASVAQATARSAPVSDIPAGPTASTSATTYLNEAPYLERHILGLVTSIVLRDAAGQEVTRSETFYDEAAFPPLTYADLAGDASYTDPQTHARGNPTTLRRYTDPAAGTYLETHAQFDQCGNPRLMWNERASAPFNEASASSETEYSPTYRYAYATRAATAAPDPGGLRGSATPLATSVVYDLETGLTLSTTDANDLTTSFSYRDEQNVPDPLLRLRKATRPDGGWTAYDFHDVPGDLRAHTRTRLDASRVTHSYQFFDGLGRVRRALSSEGGTNYIAVDTEYDALGRVRRVSNPYRTQAFGGAGHATLWTTSSYDALGRVTAVTAPDNTSAVTVYEGVYTTVTDQAGQARRQKTDALGRVVRVDEPGPSGALGPFDSPAQPTHYEYSARGDLVHVAQVSGGHAQHRYFKFDAVGRLLFERQIEQADTYGFADPVTGNSAWSRKLVYDEAVNGVSYKGLLSSSFDARGVGTRFSYDALGRLTQIAYSDGTPTQTNSYDRVRDGFYNRGRLTEVKTTDAADAPATTLSYDHDLAGRITRHVQMVGAHTYEMTYAFNHAGQLTSQSYPSGRRVSYAYDDAGRASSVSSGATVYARALAYAPHGALESASLGNGSVYTAGYNARLQLTSVSLTKDGQAVQRYEYGYGRVDMATGALDPSKNNGKVTRVEGWIGARRQWQQRFAYDAVGRLSAAGEYRGDTGQQTYLINYDHDAFGNRYQYRSRNAAAPGYSAVEEGDIVKSTNRFASGLAYDAAGNVVVDGRFTARRFSYDANNRQRESSKLDGSDAVVAVFDGIGRKVAAARGGSVEVIFVYDAFGNLVAEYGPTPARRGTSYSLADHQGSTRVVTDAAGRVVSRHDYLPYGGDIPAETGLRTTEQGYGREDGVRHEYAGMEEDEATGMSHTLWRKYDAASGRWTTPDPYGGSMDVSSPQSFNRYAYVNDDPVNHVDPTGLMLSDMGVVQTTDPAHAHLLEQQSDFDLKMSVNAEYAARNNLEVKTERTSTGTRFTATQRSQRNPRTDLPEYARRVYTDRGPQLTACINRVFARVITGRNGVTAAGANLLAPQVLENAPYVDETQSQAQLGGVLGASSWRDLSEGPNGTVHLAWDVTDLLNPETGQMVSAGEISERAFVHELGNLLSRRISRDSSARTFGDPKGVRGVRTGLDYDTGANLERCVFGNIFP